MRKLIPFILILLVALPALAQDPSPAPVTPAVPLDVTPFTVTPAIPFNATPAAIPVTLPAEDARLANCAAPMLPGFVAHVALFSVPLPDLLMGSSAFTPAQVAALNCLDDTMVPSGATVWLPQDAFAVSTPATSLSESDQAEPTVSQATIAEGNIVQNQDGITLSWESNGAAVWLMICKQPSTNNDCVMPSTADAGVRFPADGSVTIPYFWQAGEYTAQVIPVDSVNRTYDPVVIPFTVACSQASLWSSGVELCPETPALAVGGAFQPFEHGAMIWFSDTQQILVLTDMNRQARYYEDLFEEGMSNPAAVAPEGLFTPTRGFGRIWEALGGAEGSGLGWALAPEVGADVFRQPAGRNSFTTYIALPDIPFMFNAFAVTQIPGQEVGYFVHTAAESP